MPASSELLTFPDPASMALSIRAKALLFHDPASVMLLERVERIAQSDATVLIVGETGTGKELIARHVHKRSGRRGPFVAVNCGAFSENLIDAELFGHEPGAFTGAQQARAGWFEAANGGTLFLDEIGDLPLSLQVKLLRVLQERQVVRLGSRRPIALDVRLVAATNIDLQRAVEAQRFRADLYWRLSVATVDLPPLRERPGDILPLARHFIELYAGKLGLDDPQPTAEAQQALLAYPWPGNIRELENVVHHALIVCRGGVIQAGDFRFSPLLRAGGAAAAVVVPAAATVAATGAAGSAGLAGSAALPSAVGAPGGTPPAAAATLPGAVDAGSAASAAATAAAGLAAAPAASSLSSAASSPVAPSAPGASDNVLGALHAALDRLLATGEAQLFETVQEALVQQAYARCGGNQVRTARLLGLSRNTLRTLLKRHGLLADASAGRDDEEEEGPSPSADPGATASSSACCDAADRLAACEP